MRAPACRGPPYILSDRYFMSRLKILLCICKKFSCCMIFKVSDMSSFILTSIRVLLVRQSRSSPWICFFKDLHPHFLKQIGLISWTCSSCQYAFLESAYSTTQVSHGGVINASTAFFRPHPGKLDARQNPTPPLSLTDESAPIPSLGLCATPC